MSFLEGQIETDADIEYERRLQLRTCVKCPVPGTRLDWQGPSLFNNESLLRTVIERKSHVFRHQDPYRPTKRQPLPILVNSAVNGSAPLCGPRAGQNLELLELLGRGHDCPSLVWKCSVLPEGFPVVLKLLIDQNDKLPPDTYLPASVYEEQRDYSKPVLGLTAAMEISRESDSMRSLESLQGHYVPISYGFYEFIMPDNYSVLGHVMEYVPTVNILGYFREVCVPNVAAVDHFLSCLHQAFVELHRCDVVHKDAAVRNLCLLPTRESGMQFVVLDFTSSSSITYYEANGYDWGDIEDHHLEFVYEELGEDAILPWLETENGKRYQKLIRMSPKQLALL